MTDTTEAIVLRAPGGPEALRLETTPLGVPGPGQLRLRQSAAAVNFHDVYVRSGLYSTLPLPGIPGLEAVGTVEEVGEGVSEFAPGDRVAYIDSGYGGYARARVLDADRAVPIPGGISDAAAAVVFLKGITVLALVDGVRPLRGGETVLVHAAAGGVGRLVTQLAVARGARVIGTAGDPDKARSARDAGCAEVILYQHEDVAERMSAITGGRGADVIYDAVGRDTFEGSLASLALRGHLIVYGQASGPIPPFELQRLAPRSASITRASYAAYVDTLDKLRASAAALFDLIGDGTLDVQIGGEYPLEQAAQAHADLEARKAGPFVLRC